MDALTPATQYPQDRMVRLYASFFGALSPATVKARKFDLMHFAKWLGKSTGEDAGKHLISLPMGEAHLLALDYRNAQADAGIPPASINRRLSTLRQVVEFAATLGMIPWALRVKGVPCQAYRDTSGPPIDNLRAAIQTLDMFAQQTENPTMQHNAKRDRAMVWLFCSPGLRLTELRNMTTGDVDLPNSRVQITRKRRHEPEWITVPTQTRDALAAWIESNPGYEGPLFFRLDLHAPANPADRTPLGESSIRDLVEALQLGHPHGLRHAYVTMGLSVTNGNVHAVQKAAGHSSPKTTMLYDDNRRDLAGEVSQKVADHITHHPDKETQ